MASIELPALRTAFLLLSTLVVLGPPPAAVAAGEPSQYLIENGTVQADIVLSTSPTRAARLAADELQLYLGKITGEQFDIVTAPGKPVHIFVGPSDLAATYLDGNNQPITDAGLEHDSFRLVSGDGFLALIGRDRDFDHSSAENNPYSAPLLTDRWDPSDPASSWDQPVQQFWEGFTGEPWVNPIATPMYQHRDLYNTTLDIWLSDEVGSLYAVHEFLRQLGVEWYLPGSLGEIVPELDTIEIPVVDRVFEPAIRDRRISFASFSLGGAKPKNDILWYYRIGLGDDPRFWVMHTLPLIHGHPDARIAYPEYFATISGVKDFDHNDVGTPLLTSDEFVAATVEYVKAYFDAYPYAQTFPVAPGDGFKSTCDDPECQALLTPERGRNGKLSELRLAVRESSGHGAGGGSELREQDDCLLRVCVLPLSPGRIRPRRQCRADAGDADSPPALGRGTGQRGHAATALDRQGRRPSDPRLELLQRQHGQARDLRRADDPPEDDCGRHPRDGREL